MYDNEEEGIEEKDGQKERRFETVKMKNKAEERKRSQRREKEENDKREKKSNSEEVGVQEKIR